LRTFVTRKEYDKIDSKGGVQAEGKGYQVKEEKGSRDEDMCSLNKGNRTGKRPRGKKVKKR